MSKFVFRKGFLQELKNLKQIQTDEAMARILGVSRTTYVAARDQQVAPSAAMIANLFDAWGYGPEVSTTCIQDSNSRSVKA